MSVLHNYASYEALRMYFFEDKPAVIITNDMELAVEKIIRKYARRWIVEKTISEQIEFFHLNLVS